MTTSQRIREMNDAARKRLADHDLYGLVNHKLVISNGVAARGWDFIDRALDAVRDFSDFTERNDPYGEHDFGRFTLDGVELNWKIDYYDLALEYGSPDPSDAEKTTRVLTVMLAEEY
jgi:hypothetical protein